MALVGAGFVKVGFKDQVWDQVLDQVRAQVGAQVGDQVRRAVLCHVTCPSTGHQYLLRVPPTLKSCQAAISWTFGVDNVQFDREQ